VLGYSPLEAGLRFLPTTLVIVAVAPIAGRLSDRIGSVYPMATGLAVLTSSTFLFSQIDAGTTYGGLVVPFILLGLGIALVMSPMSTAAMNAVEVAKAGVASGVLTMSRMIGGSVGVAATGAIFQSKLGSGFDPAGLQGGGEQARNMFVDALGSAMGLAAVVSANWILRGSRAGQRQRPDSHDARPNSRERAAYPA
jgi:MFS family permease